MRETVNINGVYYDAKTGLPVEPEQPKLDSPPAKAKSKKITVHSPKKIIVKAAKPTRAARRPAASSTLNRRFVAKPPLKVAKPLAPKPRPVAAVRLRPTISARPSPVVARGIRRPKPTPTQSPPVATKPDLSDQERHNIKLVSIVASAAVVLIIAAAILAYIFIPAVSFWVASSRAEVNASLPTYAPVGYSVSTQAESSPGMVKLNYKSSSGDYSISMTNSNWDSDGILENKVKPNSTNYQTFNQKGLTIFVLNDQAIWVNGGVLYIISSSSELSSDEILRIVDGI
jgi:hypothetical protein